MTDSTGVGILGLGSALPERVRTHEYWRARLRPRDEAQQRGDVLAVQRQAGGSKADIAPEIAQAIAELDDPVFQGVRETRVIGDDEEISDLEAKAALEAIKNAGLAPADIDIALIHSLPSDTLIPSNAPALQHKCGLTNASAWNVDVGCASLQVQMVTAAALIRAGAAKKVLVVQSQCATRVVDSTNPQSVSFGDGAAAAVIGRVPDGFGVLGSYVRTDGSLRDGIVLAPVDAGAPDRHWWKDGGIGSLRMASFDLDSGKRAGQLGPAFCRDTCIAALRDADVGLSEISIFLGNQSVGWFFPACRLALGLPKERAFDTFGEVGNIGGATVLYNLKAALERGRIHHGDRILMYSPGAGFTRAALVLRHWHPTEVAR